MTSKTTSLADALAVGQLKSHYDFIVCGSGASGSVVARRLAEDAEVNVLLLEAGGDDDAPSVQLAAQWPLNLGTERVWNYTTEPGPEINGRTVPLSTGKVLGGGTSVNGLIWAWGHRADWDFYASESGDSGWGYNSVLDIYGRIEDWHGAPDSQYRGIGGELYVQPAPDPHPIAYALLESAKSAGVPTFKSHNGAMMEGPGGAAITDLCVRDGYRQSVYRAYVYPYRSRPNLTVLTGALVTRLVINGTIVGGVELSLGGRTYHVSADCEVVVCLGAINTAKLLMQSGIGDEAHLRAHGIPVVQHLPGVGQNFQDHVGFDLVWECEELLVPHNNGVEATYFWPSDASLSSPDVQTCQGQFPKSSSIENTNRFHPPAAGWNLFPGLVQPKSRGEVRLTGPRPDDPVSITANFLSHPDDVKAATAAIELARDIGNSAELRPFTKREIMPGRRLKGPELERFIRDAATTYWHVSGTAKMGQDSAAVVAANLKVYGIDQLRIADASIMPRITTGNTQAPCVIIGERAAEMIRADHLLSTSAEAR